MCTLHRQSCVSIARLPPSNQLAPHSRRTRAAWLFGALNLFAPTLAWAQVNCVELPGPIVVIEHGDTQSRMLQDLGRKLRDAEEPMTLVHFPRSTCKEAYFVFSGQGAEANAVPWTAEPNPENGTPSIPPHASSRSVPKC